MTIIEMLYNLNINMSKMADYMWINPWALTNKKHYWYRISDEHLKRLREFLDIKVREMIKIMKKIDKVLDDNK
jgi:hypothetical protein